MRTCAYCNGTGIDATQVEKKFFPPFACRHCNGTGIVIETETRSAFISDEHQLLLSLEKVICHSCGGDPWSAEDGCGTCGNYGYKFLHRTSHRHYKLSELKRLLLSVSDKRTLALYSRIVNSPLNEQ